MKWGNALHGRLTPDGLRLNSGTIIDSVSSLGMSGVPQVFSYIPPNGGDTRFLKNPSLPAPETPDQLKAIGAEYRNDCILFGVDRRYSPFCEAGLVNERQWLHLGTDGRWRKMSLQIDVVGGEVNTVSVIRHEVFGELNKFTAAESTVLTELNLVGASCYGPEIVDVDVRHDGRQIVVLLYGFLAPFYDPAVVSGVWEQSGQKTIVAGWTIDVNMECTAATASRFYLIEQPTTWAEEVPDSYAGSGDPYLVVKPEGGDPHLQEAFWYQHVLKELAHNVFHFKFERLIGASYSADGTLHVVKYRYESTKAAAHFKYDGTWLIVRRAIWVYFSGTTSGWVYVGPGEAPPSVAVELRGTYDLANYPLTEIPVPAVTTFTISVEDNGTEIKDFEEPPAPVVYGKRLTNNVFELRNDARSLIRAGGGASDLTEIEGAVSHASFDHRSGQLLSSATVVSFV